MLTVFVFLNEGEDHFSGFQARHRDDDLGWSGIALLPSDANDEVVSSLEQVFALLNGGTAYAHRSLSVGDVVAVMDSSAGWCVTYAVERFGWQKLSPALTDQLGDDVRKGCEARGGFYLELTQIFQ